MHLRSAVLAAAVIVPVAVVAAMAPVTASPTFHDYEGARVWLVLSNLPFVIVGALGLRRAPAFFAAVIAIGVGSAAYHADPCDATLVVDWLPIALACGWLVARVVDDRIGTRAGAWVFALAPIAALASIGWWWWSGDLRWYGAFQGESVALVPLIALLYPGGRLRTRWLLAGVAGFVLARVCNAFDGAMLDLIGVSGHTCKHLCAAAAVACMLGAC